MTSSDQEKCSLTSFLSMSCRGRAEAFARSLHSRLRSLGSQDDPEDRVDESSWLARSHDTNAISVTQPTTTENDLYFDLQLESPGSPEEELDGSELDKLLNKDGLRLDKAGSCECSNSQRVTHSDLEEIGEEDGEDDKKQLLNNDKKKKDNDELDRLLNKDGLRLDKSAGCECSNSQRLLHSDLEEIDEGGEDENLQLLNDDKTTKNTDELDKLLNKDGLRLDKSATCECSNSQRHLHCDLKEIDKEDSAEEKVELLNDDEKKKNIDELDKLLNKEGLTLHTAAICQCSNSQRLLQSALKKLGEEDVEEEQILFLNNDAKKKNDDEIHVLTLNDCSCLNNLCGCYKEVNHSIIDELDRVKTNKTDEMTVCMCIDTGKKLEELRSHLVENGKNDSDSSDGLFYDTENDLESVISEECPKLPLYTNDPHQEIATKEKSIQLNGYDALSQTSEDSSSNHSSLVTITCECVDSPSDTSEMFTSSLDISNELTLEVNSAQINPVTQPLTFETKKQVETDEDDEESEERTPRVRRCSSLKTGKTPPGTPGSKKIVRFADVLGLDLADVRTFLDEIPKVPISAYDDLPDADLDDSDVSISSSLDYQLANHGIKVDRVLVPLFQQPGGQPDFLDKVRDTNVHLENTMIQDPVTLTLAGTVRVRNLDFHKSVYIRYSLDLWQSFADLQAIYIENSCDGFSDKFAFTLNCNNVTLGQRVELAVRFQCKGTQYWDNNNGVNYCFQCLPSSNYEPHGNNGHLHVDDKCGASFYY